MRPSESEGASEREATWLAGDELPGFWTPRATAMHRVAVSNWRGVIQNVSRAAPRRRALTAGHSTLGSDSQGFFRSFLDLAPVPFLDLAPAGCERMHGCVANALYVWV